MSIATTLSRITGFVRIWATALALGATGLASAYNVANNIPNMIFELVAGGILSSVFIPTYVELRENRGLDRAQAFASHVGNLAVLTLGLVGLVGILNPRIFIWTQTFRLDPAQAEAVRPQAEFFFRVFAIQVAIYGAGMVVQAVLNAERRYLWPALGPVFNNVTVIVTMLAYWAMDEYPPEARNMVLAVGTTLGVAMMFAVMVPSLVRSRFRYHTGLGVSDPVFRHMLALAIPTVIYVATNLVSVSFRNASAYAVAEEGPSVLSYAWVFYQLPYGILAVALATAVFTELSESAGTRRMTAFKEMFGRGLRLTLVLILPSAAMLFALAEPLVSLFRIGAFTARDVPIVASILRGWSVSLVFYAATMYLLRTFYALKDTRTPMLANLALSVVQVALYLVLTTGLASWAGLGLEGIPVADAVFFALMVSTLALLLRRRIGGFDLRGVADTFWRMGVASAAGGLVAYATAAALAPLARGFAGGMLQAFSGGALGIAVTFSVGRLLSVREVGTAFALAGRVLGRWRAS